MDSSNLKIGDYVRTLTQGLHLIGEITALNSINNGAYHWATIKVLYDEGGFTSMYLGRIIYETSYKLKKLSPLEVLALGAE